MSYTAAVIFGNSFQLVQCARRSKPLNRHCIRTPRRRPAQICISSRTHTIFDRAQSRTADPHPSRSGAKRPSENSAAPLSVSRVPVFQVFGRARIFGGHCRRRRRWPQLPPSMAKAKTSPGGDYKVFFFGADVSDRKSHGDG